MVLAAHAIEEAEEVAFRERGDDSHVHGAPIGHERRRLLSFASMPRTTRRCIGIGLAAAILVLICQLWPPFLANTYGPMVGVVTLIAVAAFGWRTSGLIVAPVMVCLTPALTIIALWSAQRAHHTFQGTSDLVDGMVMFAFGVCGPAGVALGVWLERHQNGPLLVRRARTSLVVGLVVVLSAFVYQGMGRSPAGKVELADAIVSFLGVAVAVGFSLRARAAARELARDDGGRPGQHRGDGWIDVEGHPPVHHAALVGTKAGPVVVHGLAGEKERSYRAGQAPEIRVERSRVERTFALRQRIAGSYLLGAAALCASSLKVFAAAVLSL